MFFKEKKMNLLYKKIDELNKVLTNNNVIDLAELLGNRKEMIKRNIIAGIAKGIGIGIGVTIITALIVYLLQKIVKLNIPIIGKYIADIVEIVQKSK